jgi:nucleoside-diphosphate-sugar epimerase
VLSRLGFGDTRTKEHAMKVFVAGATGALGKQLVPRLVAAGHDVVGMTRSEERAGLVRELGAEPAVADALDPDAVGAAISAARPEVIVHQLTALSGSLDLRHFDRDFAQTNRLRTEGTDILLSAARAAGTRVRSRGIPTGAPCFARNEQRLAHAIYSGRSTVGGA